MYHIVQYVVFSYHIACCLVIPLLSFHVVGNIFTWIVWSYRFIPHHIVLHDCMLLYRFINTSCRVLPYHAMSYRLVSYYSFLIVPLCASSCRITILFHTWPHYLTISCCVLLTYCMKSCTPISYRIVYHHNLLYPYIASNFVVQRRHWRIHTFKIFKARCQNQTVEIYLISTSKTSSKAQEVSRVPFELYVNQIKLK